MKRRVYSAVAGLALVFLACSTVQAIQSYRGVGFHRSYGGPKIAFYWNERYGYFQLDGSVGPQPRTAVSIVTDMDNRWHLAGIKVELGRFHGGGFSWFEFTFGLYAWQAVLFSAIVLTCALYDRRRLIHAERRRKGSCLACGYDLRATPDRCPECGAVPAASRSEDSPSKSTADEPVHGI